jgi:hypothetical protein
VKFANFKCDVGSVVLEFIGYGLLLQVPLLMLVIGLSAAQHDQLVAEAIARDSLRSFMLIDKAPESTASEVAKVYGLSVDRVHISISCQDNDCLKAGNKIRVITKVGLMQAEANGLK